MATYNRSHLILESVKSIAAQTFYNWECLIIDDGSNDNTPAVIEDFSKKDGRFKYFQRSAKYLKGLPGCRNYGLDLAKGTFVIFFDDDDVVHPRNLEICLEILQGKNLDFCHYRKQSFTQSIPVAPTIIGSENFYKIGQDQIEQVVMNKIPLASCTVMWKKECFDKIRFNESLSYAEEWECYTRILLEGYKGIGIDDVLYYNRKHPASNTGEFWLGDEKRKASQVKAVKLVIKNLKQKNLLYGRLIRYFVQMSVFLKNKTILEYILRKSNMTIIEKIKYRLFYKFYPILVLGHRTMKLLKK